MLSSCKEATATSLRKVVVTSRLVVFLSHDDTSLQYFILYSIGELKFWIWTISSSTVRGNCDSREFLSFLCKQNSISSSQLKIHWWCSNCGQIQITYIIKKWSTCLWRCCLYWKIRIFFSKSIFVWEVQKNHKLADKYKILNSDGSTFNVHLIIYDQMCKHRT